MKIFDEYKIQFFDMDGNKRPVFKESGHALVPFRADRARRPPDSRAGKIKGSVLILENYQTCFLVIVILKNVL